MKIIIVMEGGVIQNIVTDTPLFNSEDCTILVKDYDKDIDPEEQTKDREGKPVHVALWMPELWEETEVDFLHFEDYLQSGDANDSHLPLVSEEDLG